MKENHHWCYVIRGLADGNSGGFSLVKAGYDSEETFAVAFFKNGARQLTDALIAISHHINAGLPEAITSGAKEGV